MATEEPVFDVRLKDGAFELRDYSAMVVAEVTVGGSREQASNAGFRLLAGYIFGGNTRQQSIPMTAPVIQQSGRGESIAMTAPVTQTGIDGAWVVRFVMPSGSVQSEMPEPEDARVRLTTLPASRFAVVRFSGLANDKDIAEKTAKLEDLIAKHRLTVTSAVSLARYDPPWTPWFLRRNEVMRQVEVVPAK